MLRTFRPINPPCIIKETTLTCNCLANMHLFHDKHVKIKDVNDTFLLFPILIKGNYE